MHKQIHLIKKNFRKEVLVSVYSYYSFSREVRTRSQCRNYETGTEAEATDKFHLVAFSLWHIKPAFLITQDYVTYSDTSP